jgi:hypothetical protein
MRQAAIELLGALDEKLREQVMFPFEGPKRKGWQFVPMERWGVPFKQLSLEQRRAAWRLVRTGLSSQGALKAATIMTLESELRVLEADRPNVEQIRDQEKYCFAVYGDPASESPWGWRLEGHHLSLNFTSTADLVVAMTPAFFGANPAELRSGPRAGLRVLGNEEDLARELLRSASAAQQTELMIGDVAPNDVLGLPGVELHFAGPVGLDAGAMNENQQKLLRCLIAEVIENFSADLAEPTWQEIEAAGFENIHFAWAGGAEVGQPHYFRIHGPTFVVEYDNTQNDANHAHLVWHSPTNDFGADALRRHYAESPHHQQ